MPYLDSHLILDRCPHCKVANPNLTREWSIKTDSYDLTDLRHWSFYKCGRCGGITTASSYEEDGDIIAMYPKETIVDEVVPNKAKAFLKQAVDSLHAPSGAIMLAASSIDAMLKEKGLIEGNLYNRINEAAKNHLITEDMAKWAHEIRLDANDERHADVDANLPDSSAAKKTVDFALALAEFLFILPSKVQRGLKDAKSKPE